MRYRRLVVPAAVGAVAVIAAQPTPPAPAPRHLAVVASARHREPPEPASTVPITVAAGATVAAVVAPPLPVVPVVRKIVSLPTAVTPRAAGAVNPGGKWACIIRRESGGNYGAVNPSSGAGGAYQFLPSSWRAYGGSGLPQNASPAEQDRIARVAQARSGWAPWAGGNYAC